MSKIAEALAKAKERTGNTSAPFLTGASQIPGPTDEAKARVLRQAAKARRFWIALLIIAGIGTIFVLWDRLRPEPSAPSPSNQTRPAPAAGPVATPSPSATTAPTHAATETPAASPVAASPVAPRPETQNTVNDLVITAVLPGERPRLMYQGRIVAMGEAIMPGLTFNGVREGRLLFTDARGATYERRY